MRPIEYRTDLNFMQALRCVEYRLPRQGSMHRSAYMHAVGLRYGLMGAAASHFLLLGARDDEEMPLMESIANWPLAVEEHFRWEVMTRLPLDPTPLLPTNLANQAYMPVVTYLDMYRRLCPLDECLNSAVDRYVKENADEIRSGWSLFANPRPMRDFKETARESVRFALLFFERRQAGLEEVPEIALLGE